MRRILLLVGIAIALLSAPLELSARHIVRHHTARAQGCGVGQTPPTTGCGIGDMSVGGALSSTDAIAICQQSGGCPASASTWQLTKVQLLPSIRGALSATSPLTYNSGTGAFGCTPFSSSNLTNGCVPSSSGGTVNYLRADGTWAQPPTASGSGVNAGTANQLAYYAATGSVVSGSTSATLIAGGGLNINRTGGTMPAAPGSTIIPALWAAGAAGENTALVLDTVGASGTTPTIILRHAETGTTAIQFNDGLGTLAWRGYGANGYSSNAVARVTASALENFSDTSQGTQVAITSNPVGSISPVTQASFGPGVSIGTPTGTPSPAMVAGDLNVAGRIMQNSVPISTTGGGAVSVWAGTVGGTSTAYTGTPNAGLPAFTNAANNMFCGNFPNASTGAATLAVGAAAALPIHVQSGNSTALAGAGDIPGGVNLCLQIDPTNSFWVKTTVVPGKIYRDPTSYTVSSVDWATGATVIFTGAVAPTVTFPAVAGTLSSGSGITVVAAPGANVTFTPNAADGINGLPINTPAVSNGGLSMAITTTGIAGLGALTIPLGETKIYPFSWGPGMNLSTVPIPLLTRGTATPAVLGTINCTPGGLVPSPATVDIYMAADNVPATGAGGVVAVGTKLTATSCDATVNSGKLQPQLQITTGTGVIPAGNHLWVVASGAGWNGTLTGISGEIQVGVSP